MYGTIRTDDPAQQSVWGGEMTESGRHVVAAWCVVAGAAQQAAKVGHNVTPEAQQIFNALAKTMPCTWRDRDIIVMTDVRRRRRRPPALC